MVVAVSTNNVIGADGRLPWRLPEDLKRFKEITMGKPIVMGRLTYESIGRPLPGRQNIVITRQAGYVAKGCDVVSSPADALRAAGNVGEVMIIGGGEIYRQFLRRAQRVYLTRVHQSIDGDAYFPGLPDDEWQLTGNEDIPAGEAPAFSFQVFERIPSG
jgi:dihydrofolate reductase